MSILPGTPVIASTLRQPAALAPGQTAGYATQLASLTLRQLEGVLFQQPTDRFSPDALGVAAEHPGVVFADWPAGVTVPNPIKSGDMLKLSDGTEYRIVGARGYVGQYLQLLLEMNV